MEKRPTVKEFFGEASLDHVHNSYLSSPELFKYAQALDNYIDELENISDKSGLKWIKASERLPPQPKYGEEKNYCCKINGCFWDLIFYDSGFHSRFGVAFASREIEWLDESHLQPSASESKITNDPNLLSGDRVNQQVGEWREEFCEWYSNNIRDLEPYHSIEKWVDQNVVTPLQSMLNGSMDNFCDLTLLYKTACQENAHLKKVLDEISREKWSYAGCVSKAKEALSECSSDAQQPSVDLLQQQLDEMRAERDQLKDWKESAIKVMPDYQKLGRLLGIKLGHSVSGELMEKVEGLVKENERMAKVIKGKK